ncbi:uncharacterized protein LOC127852795 [Dreissena polymorpha]|nr:uncharacterized protein LOC127852795 [Dreissena polymorpha]XP_052242742.1 uncharacterized protein LOC127852795 [Dreissena polymorpha]
MHESRNNISVILQRRLTSAAGTGKLPRLDIMPEIEACVVDTCGGCPSAGSVWKEKVLKCTKMILKYLARASVPFQPLLDKVSIFNSDIAQSSVHSLACHDGRVCVENTQIYALLLPLTTATYMHENADELIFGGADNPSPLLEIVEQELAWRAVGNVDVYLESAKDVNSLRNTIQILMMYNKNVSLVTFHIDSETDEDDVIITLQRKVGLWLVSYVESTRDHVLHDDQDSNGPEKAEHRTQQGPERDEYANEELGGGLDAKIVVRF